MLNVTERQLVSILDTMDVPKERKDITISRNLFWLLRNLGIRNGQHKEFKIAMGFIKRLCPPVKKRKLC